MAHLVAAPDKFRGTATAVEVAAAVGRAARSCGWTADEVPLADGGEGTLETIGGDAQRTVVTGPLGRPVTAQWRMLRSPPPGLQAWSDEAKGPVALVEAARAAGRSLVPSPAGDDPVRATTAGVGELVLAAVDAGARLVLVGAGGSATTDGGWGAVSVIGSPARLRGVPVIVACDVRTPFRDAAVRFGPQKGATARQVLDVSRRLDDLAVLYWDTYGVDVDALPGSGAAGGLAGGLAALGGRLVPGFELVAAVVGLDRRLASADLVVTGEGHLDAASFDGKVVGGVIDAADGRPVLCVVGDADDTAVSIIAGRANVELVRLVPALGREGARTDAAGAVAEVVRTRLAAYRRSGQH